MQETTENQAVRTVDDYRAITAFAEKYNRISYPQLDSHILHSVNLFALLEDYDFDALEATVSRILATLPAIKRIFARPITRLKDTSEILPVESVHVINTHTVSHAAVHSELWGNITEDGLKPRKLMTLNHKDDYAIYENVAFTRTVNIILHFVTRHIRILRDMLYASKNQQFNLLERNDHMAYFLAIGKLRVGYVRNYDGYRVAAQRCLDSLVLIERTVRARLKSPVYRQCNRYHGRVDVKKTNIFHHHKDYHRVYNLLKWFAETNITEQETEELPEERDYRAFCLLLSLFSAGHFNFSFDDSAPIDFFAPHVEASFDDWRLTVDSVRVADAEAIRMTVRKEREYRVAILPTVSEDTAADNARLQMLRESGEADLCVAVSPREGVRGQRYVSLYDIESFRRLQQLLLEAMIVADETRETCPFCGQPLRENADTASFDCAACRTRILHPTCPETGKAYYASAVVGHMPEEVPDNARRDKILYGRFLESQLHFRNITPLSERAELLCPHCGNVHA